jgi:hypothetical protein
MRGVILSRQRRGNPDLAAKIQAGNGLTIGDEIRFLDGPATSVVSPPAPCTGSPFGMANLRSSYWCMNASACVLPHHHGLDRKP